MTTLPLPPLVLASTSEAIIIASGSTLHLTSLSSTSTTSTSASSSSSTSHQPNLIRHIAISPDSTRAAATTDLKTLHTYTLILSPLTIIPLSTRTITKKASHLTFSPSGDILLSDKVGDVYLYPFTPHLISPESRPPTVQLTSDPTLNPDAKLLLGHTSVLTSHIMTPDARHIITSDRDEHIRVSRFPQTYVVERYLFGSEGFVGAMHVPKTRAEILISGGGEDRVRIWDWEKGVQVGSVGVWGEVLGYRRVRCGLRKVKGGGRDGIKRRRLEEKEKEQVEVVQAGKKGDAGAQDEEVNGEDEELGFYDAPEGHILPTGQGVCLKKIDSLDINGETIVLFFSEGAAAIHTFILPKRLDSAAEPISIQSFPTNHPILDFTPFPTHSNQFLVSLDTAFETLSFNQTGWSSGKRKNPELSADDAKRLSQTLIIVEVDASGRLSNISSQHSTLLSSIHASLSQPHLLFPPSAHSSLTLHENLNLLPRWPGHEEDDDEANPNLPNSLNPPNEDTTSQTGTLSAAHINRVYTRDELEGLGLKELGRLRARGVDVEEVVQRKRKEGKGKPAPPNPGKRARNAMKGDAMKEKGGREVEESGNGKILDGEKIVDGAGEVPLVGDD